MSNKLKVETDVDNEIHMTRTFNAPKRLVIQAMSTGWRSDPDVRSVGINRRRRSFALA